MLLALDPGIRGLGLSVFRESRLFRATYVRNLAKTGDTTSACRDMAFSVEEQVFRWGIRLEDVTRAIFEWPRVYTASKSKGDNNDLLALCGVDSAVSMIFRKALVESVHPDAWKGQLDDLSTAKRVIQRLDEDERSRIEWKGRNSAESILAGKLSGNYDHNSVDSVGVGLHALGRFERHRVFER